ncbi:MAG: hypothetical protein NTZ10_02645 [Candidatus Saganbacteria bacterium]|nr:hypothetical protein [Candidatus Saganbacteria bacterium]
MAHPIELLPDIARKYPFANNAPKWFLKGISKLHPPVILSKITGYKGRDGRTVDGWVVFCSLSTRMMLLNEKRARTKILKAAKFSEKLDAKLLGLGAFVPIVTDHGAYLQGKVKMSITNGDAFSAVIAAKNVIKAADLAGLDKEKVKLAVVGAAGFVGSMSSKLLLKYFSDITLIDKNKEDVKTLGEELKKKSGNKNIVVSFDISDIKNADIVLTVTNTPGVIVRSKHLKTKSIIIDAAQPRNVSVKVPYEREDVIVIESGVAEVDGLNVNCDFGLRKENEVYSCFAELLLLCWMREYNEDHVNRISESYVLKLWDEMEKAGIRMASFRNVKQSINTVDFNRVFGGN